MDSETIERSIQTRLPAAGALLSVVAAGLVARYFLDGSQAKYLGVAFWAMAVYSLILVAAPSAKIMTVAICALAISWGVEFAQMTPLPAWLSSNHIVLRWIFGTTFSAWDLPAYAIGIGFYAGAHMILKNSLGDKTKKEADQ